MLRSVFEGLRDSSAVNGALLFNLLYAFTAMISTCHNVWNQAYTYIVQFFLVTVMIDNHDPPYHDIVLWMNQHVFRGRQFRFVKAVTRKQSTSWGDLYPKRSHIIHWEEDSRRTHLADKSPREIQLNPLKGSRYFRFKNNWIFFSHLVDYSYASYTGRQHGEIKLQCVGLSLDFLHQFLAEASAYSRKLSQSYVTIYRVKSDHGHMLWDRVSTRPLRDMSTIILDKEKKDLVLSDITEFLESPTKKWYGAHGIPYRRGYLFSGPPGTGKTSLASAIAGMFSLISTS